MAFEKCNITDKQELDYLRSLRKKGIDGERMLKDIGGYDPATGIFRVGNIRLDKFDVTPEVKDFMKDLIQEGHYYVEQRRGTINFEKNGELAREIAPSLKLKAGQTLNSEELESLASAVGGLSLKAQEAAALAAKEPSEINVAKATAARLEANIAMASLSGAKSEAGRALSIQRKIMKGIVARDYKVLRTALKLGKGKYNGEQIAGMLSKIDANDPFAQYRFLQSLRVPKLGDYLMELWYNSILSGPITHLRNLIGNTANTAWLVASHPGAVLYDVVRAAKTGNPRSIRLSEMNWQAIQQAFHGGLVGAQKGLAVMKTGFTPDDVAMLELRQPEAFKGGFGAVINTPKRLLSASDAVARNILQQADLYGRAFNVAKNEGLKGAEFDQRMAELLAQPTPEMMEGAEKFATRNVFQEEGGNFLSGMSRLRDSIEIAGIKPMRFVIPFIETPANVFKLGIRATPIGFFRKAKTEREAARDFGSALLGSLLLIPIAMLAAAGRISGSGPSDKKKKEALYRTGWQPYSVKIGDKWYSYLNMTPISTSLSWVGNYFDGFQFDGVLPDTAGLFTLSIRNMKSILDQSYLSGLNGLISAINGTAGQQQTYINRLATSLVPQFWQQSVRFFDPTVFDTTNIGDAFKSALGLHDGLPTKYDAFGTPIKRQRASGLPIFPSKEAISPLEKKLIDLGVESIGAPPDKIGKHAMTPQQYSQFSKKVGDLLKQRLSDNDMLPPGLTPMDAQNIVDEMRAQTIKEVRADMFPDVSGDVGYSENSIQNPNGIIDNVMVYAKALNPSGGDPVTAFERMFTGQRIRYVTNGTVVVFRPSVEKSQAIAKALGDTKDLYLDHTIPLQLGGSNSRGNLKLVPKDIWQSYTPVEDHLGYLLRAGNITHTKAQKLIKQFKNGEIAADSILQLK